MKKNDSSKSHQVGSKNAAQTEGSAQAASECVNESCWFDAHVGVHPNGNISIMPELYESEKEPVTPKGGTLVSQGRMLMSSDGTAQYVAYNQLDGPRFRLLCSTEHGRVKAYDKSLIIDFKFPVKGLSNEMIAKALRDESGMIYQQMKGTVQ